MKWLKKLNCGFNIGGEENLPQNFSQKQKKFVQDSLEGFED